MAQKRLARLKNVIQKDVDALPDLPPATDKHEDGGMRLPAAEGKGKPATTTDKRLVHVSKATEENKKQSESGGWKVDSKTQPMQSSTSSGHAQQSDAAATSMIRQVFPTSSPSPATTAVLYSMLGKLGPVDSGYCPILPLSKYPYKFVDWQSGEKITDRFFNGGKFFSREWELYYVWPPSDSLYSKPLILVPERQALLLLDEVNSAFPYMNCEITDYQRQCGLVMYFPNHPRCTPRSLGRSNSKDEYEKLLDLTPPGEYPTAGEKSVPPPDKRTLAEFKRLCEAGHELNKQKKAKAKAKQREDRQYKHKSMTDQLKRTQQYMGLRPPQDLTEGSPLDNPNMAVDERHAAALRTQPVKLLPVNPDQAVPYPFDRSVVFIAVDCEAWERNNKMITEIGFATLDMDDVLNVAPGKNCENWFPKIRHRHFRIKEHMGCRNGTHVEDNADRFEFGESEIISKRDTNILASVFKPPYSKGFSADKSSTNGSEENLEHRDIILVGHDTGNDIDYLRQAGFDPLNRSNLLEVLDTAVIWRAFKREQSNRKIGDILYELEMVGWNLHNAGNDAAYTLQMVLAMCLKEALQRSMPKEALKKERQEQLEKDVEKATKLAEENVTEAAATWPDDDDDDDGVVVEEMRKATI